MPAKPLLEWRAQARADLLEIVAYIADDNPDAAQALKDEIEAKAAKLPEHPKLYKPSTRVKGMRELVVRGNYIVLYRETSQRVEVVNVLHARRQWPPLKKPVIFRRRLHEMSGVTVTMWSDIQACSKCGNISMKRVRPCAEVTLTLPPCASTIALVMAKPSPAPSEVG